MPPPGLREDGVTTASADPADPAPADLADRWPSVCGIGEGDWQRTGRRTNGSLVTLETLGRYFLHDLTHLLHDVRG